jgi:5-methylcytosine-specific restriction endonuclease McrA
MLAFPKPERRSTTKRRAERQWAIRRRICRDAVYAREQMICQRCGTLTKHPADCHEADPERAHVNEPGMRSKGADSTNPDECELVHQKCHMPGGQHAPTVERMRTIQKRLRKRVA